MQNELTTTFRSPTFRTRFEERSPSLRLEAELTHLRSIFERNPKMEDATPNSVIGAMYAVASVGLSLNPVRQQCTIITRNVRQGNNWVTEAHYMPMYRGLVKLGYETGAVASFDVQNVYAQDHFKPTLGTKIDIEHIPANKPQGTEDNPYVATYVITRLKDSSEPQVELVWAEDMHAIRDNSDSYLDRNGDVRKSSPWVKWFGEMAKKAALKRAMKRWPQSENEHWDRLAQAIELDNKADQKPMGETVDAEPLISTDQLTALRDALKEAETATGDPGFSEQTLSFAFSIESLAELPADRYEEALARVNNRRAKLEEIAQQKALAHG